MVARTQSGALQVTFSRPGEDDESHRAPSPEPALKIALLMLATQDALYHGDRPHGAACG